VRGIRPERNEAEKMEHSEFDWEDLVDAIIESSLIPVVGSEVRLLDVDGETMSVERWSLEQLPEKLDLDNDSPVVSLNELATQILRGVPLSKRERRKRRIARRMVEIFEDRPPPIPESLLKLAEITHFNLFLTTAVDTLLEQAIEKVRGVPCRTLTNALNGDIDDLDDVSAPDEPVVYHLFGSMPRGDFPGTDIAVTEEDKIEYLQRIGDSARKPQNLVDYIEENELMFLGCNVSDGVAKMMLRKLSDRRLFPEKSFKFVCGRDNVEHSFQLFLEGLNTDLLLTTDSREFTDEMHRRWRSVADDADDVAAQALPATTKRYKNDDESFVFVSYRRDDKPAVKRVIDSLEKKMKIWWDDDMESGLWENQIETKINRCSLFIPILSQRGREPGGSTAKKEWNMALERRQEFSDDETFIVPLIIDDLEHNADKIPSGLWKEQVYSCRNGKLDDKTLGRIVSAYRSQVRSMQVG
jgi:hypothetical protein